MSFQLLLADRWTWNMPLLIAVLILALLYAIYITHVPNNRLISIRPILFITGLGLFYLLTGTPLKPLSQLSFSLHMIQMSLLYFIVPPLFLAGIQSAFYTFRSIRIPFIALGSFASLFFLYHLPFVLQLFAQHTTYQALYLNLLLCLAFGMWLPLTQFKPSNQKKYALLNGIMITPACILFILSAFVSTGNNPFITQLTVHLCLPAGNSWLLPPPFNTRFDQVIAGILMIFIHKTSTVMCLRLACRITFLDKRYLSIHRGVLTSKNNQQNKALPVNEELHSR